MGLSTTVSPTGAAADLDAIKLYLRIDGTAEDALVSDLIDESAEFLESETQRQLLTATKALTLDQFPYLGWPVYVQPGTVIQQKPERVIYLPTPPLQSVTSVEYLTGGAYATLDPSLYTVDTSGVQGRIVLNDSRVWPTTDKDANAVRITFVCGYGDTASALPKRIQRAMKWLCGHAYENREVTLDGKFGEMPYGVRTLIESLMFREAHAA